MSERFIASTQYGDLKGTAAFDGHEGPPLWELAKLTDMPKGYVPLGFELFRLSPMDNGKVPFTLVAAPTEKYGSKIQDIIDTAGQTGQIHLHRFEGELAPERFEAYFKRTDIKVIQKAFENVEITASRPGE